MGMNGVPGGLWIILTLIDLPRYPITTGLCIALQEWGEIGGWIKAIRGMWVCYTMGSLGVHWLSGFCDKCVLLTAYHQLSSMLECKQHRLIGLQSAVLSLVFYLWGLSRCSLHRVTSVWCLIALSQTGSLWTATFDLSLKSKQAINLILSDQKTNIIAIWLQSE